MRARSSTGPHILSLAGEASWEAKTVRGFHGAVGGADLHLSVVCGTAVLASPETGPWRLSEMQNLSTTPCPPPSLLFPLNLLSSSKSAFLTKISK